MNYISFAVHSRIFFDQMDAATKFCNTLSLTDLALLLSNIEVGKTFGFKAYNDKLIIFNVQFGRIFLGLRTELRVLRMFAN